MVLLSCNTKTAQRSPESGRGWIPPLRPGVSIGARGSEGTMLSWDPPDPRPGARQDGLGCSSHQIWRNPGIAPAILPPFHIVPLKPCHLEQPYLSKREMSALCGAGGGWGAPAQQPGLPRHQQCSFRPSRVDQVAFWGKKLRSLRWSSCHLNGHGWSGLVRLGNVGAHVLCFQLIFSIVISLNF